MARQQNCGRPEAAQRAKVTRSYLTTGQLAASEQTAEARNVAAGNAVLAAIAAADAICCLRVGRRNRSENHSDAIALLKLVEPDGQKFGRDMATVLAVKDPSHYGIAFVSEATLKATLRAAEHLVLAAETLLVTG